MKLSVALLVLVLLSACQVRGREAAQKCRQISSEFYGNTISEPEKYRDFYKECCRQLVDPNDKDGEQLEEYYECVYLLTEGEI